MCKHIHHFVQIPLLWIFMCLIVSARLADDSSVFVITCHLKFRDIPESCISRRWTRPIRAKINIDRVILYLACKHTLTHIVGVILFVISDNNVIVNWYNLLLQGSKEFRTSEIIWDADFTHRSKPFLYWYRWGQYRNKYLV